MNTNKVQAIVLVSVQQLVKVYNDPKKGQIRAADGITFTAQPGQVFGLLGVNGAGKTTVMRVLATLLQPNSGTASVAGYDVTKNSSEVRRSIGFLSSSMALYGRLTVRQTLEYFGGLYGMRGNELKQAVDRAIDIVNVGEFADKLCDRLSTGQKQRSSIARAILHDPQVLFFDEPTAGLDVVNAQTVMEFVEEARTSGKTIIYSTHIMSEAERLCDTMTIIHEGQVKWSGTNSEAITFTGKERLEKAFLDIIGYQPEVKL